MRVKIQYEKSNKTKKLIIEITKYIPKTKIKKVLLYIAQY